MRNFLLCLTVLILVSACQPGLGETATAPTVTSVPPTALPALTVVPTFTSTMILTATPLYTPTNTLSPTPDTRPLPRAWSSWPIVPVAGSHMAAVFQEGQKKGISQYTFSAVGDCQSLPGVFMGIYGTDRNPIGANSPNLLETITLFRDSFNHDSAAVRDGLSAPSALDPFWSDPARCNPTESPVACELRLYNSAIVFVNLGTNWRAGASADAYEGYLRKIVELILANGSVPILSNKADNVEGDHSLNLATAKVAYDYDVPLMNFWLASDPLPNHGLDPERDNIYLTPAAWDVRNNVALRTLDSVWRSLQGQAQ
jgi:hypothetical protein